MNTVSIADVTARWNDPATRPLFKGKLIDMPPPGSDEQPCMCAQGDILHEFCGWDFEGLQNADQREADLAVAKALNISVAHSVLLRDVNDQADGAPSVVLEEPEKILGPEAARVLKFWRYLDAMTTGEWKSVVAAAAADTARYAARYAASEAARYAASEAASEAARYATNEIQGHAKLDSLFFLPMFGFATISDIDAWEPSA